MLKDYYEPLKNANFPSKKGIVKKGTISVNVVEATPVVWQGKLYRFEWARNSQWGGEGGIDRKVGAYRFVNMDTGEMTPEFAEDHSFGCCYTENGVMYAHGTRGPGGGNILDAFYSQDLVNWQSRQILSFPENIRLYNTSVCKGRDGYIMAIEIGGENKVVGQPFTVVFAKSCDLLNWEMLPMEKYVYTRERYTGCPTIRYYDGYYYIVYLEAAPCHRWIPYIARSKDLCSFELGIKNPFMMFDDNDKLVQHPEKFTEQQLDYIENAVDCNNSDVDFCDYNGKTVIIYSWGNQLGKEFLAQAEYDGTLQELLESYFAD